LLGAVFILVSDALREGESADPPGNMQRTLVFMAVVACVVVPLPLCLGLFGRGVRSRRLEVDKAAAVGEGLMGVGVDGGVG